MTFLKIIAMLLLVATVVESVDNAVNNCTFLSELESALYNTASNKRHLNDAFFPPKQLTSRYILVTYNFTTEDGFYNGSSCEVTYIWAIGGFLFIEPPSLFQFLSLLFNFPANDLTRITLTLPYQCRGLVFISEEKDCSCNSTGNILEQLTQQVNTILCHKQKVDGLYSQFALFN